MLKFKDRIFGLEFYQFVWVLKNPYPRKRERDDLSTDRVPGWPASCFLQTVVKLSQSWRVPVLPSGFYWGFSLALTTGTDGIRILCDLFE